MGIISKPHFDFKDLSGSSHEIIYRYLSDANKDVPTDIRDAILDTYNHLRYAMQFERSWTLPGRATIPSTPPNDDFVADCVPGPLVKEPVQFNVSRPNSVGSRLSSVRSLKTHSVGSRRSLGRKNLSGVKKIDSVIDPDSPVSLKRLSDSSYSPGTPLRYSFSAMDFEDDISTTSTEIPMLFEWTDGVDLGMQMDGAADDEVSARRQQYPTWLTAKARTVTPIKRSVLPQMEIKENLGMYMDGAADDDDLSKVLQRQLEDCRIERSMASAYAMDLDHENEVSQHDHPMNHFGRQQDEVEQDTWRQRGLARRQSPAPSAYAPTIFTEADSVYDGQDDRPLRRGRDNLSYYEPDVAAPDSGEAPSLPAFSPSAFHTDQESSRHLQDEPSTQALPLHSSLRSDDGKPEVTRQWDLQIVGRQKADREAPENSYEMQIRRQNHSPSSFGQRGGFHDNMPSIYEQPPPPSPTEIEQPRQGEFQSRVEQLVRGETPMSPPFSPARASSHGGQVSTLLYSHENDDDRNLMSPRHGLNRPGTRLSQMQTVVDSEYSVGRYSHHRDRWGTMLSATIVNSVHQPDHIFEVPLSQDRPAGPDRHDSSHGLRHNDRLPQMRMSKLNRFLVVSYHCLALSLTLP